jgi:outer membrane protein assembly factor BamB
MRSQELPAFLAVATASPSSLPARVRLIGQLNVQTTMTGAKQWSFGTHGPVDDSSPVIVGHTVSVGSLDHRVYALDALRGAEEDVSL